MFRAQLRMRVVLRSWSTSVSCAACFPAVYNLPPPGSSKMRSIELPPARMRRPPALVELIVRGHGPHAAAAGAGLPHPQPRVRPGVMGKLDGAQMASPARGRAKTELGMWNNHQNPKLPMCGNVEGNGSAKPLMSTNVR